LASVGLLCWNPKTVSPDSSTEVTYLMSLLFGNDYHAATNDDKPKCYYKFDIFGSFGKTMRKSFNNTGFLYIIFLIINWIHLVLNLAASVLISILLKITLKNVCQGTTTYERHLQKMAKKDTSLGRELKENFLDKEENNL
jgi:hypothetical protein